MSIRSAEIDVESTNFLPFLKGLADIEVEIVIVCVLDQCDDIYSLKHIGDNAYKHLASFITGKASYYRRYSGLAHWISHCSRAGG